MRNLRLRVCQGAAANVHQVGEGLAGGSACGKARRVRSTSQAIAFIHHDMLVHWCKSKRILLGARPVSVREKFSLPL